MDEEQHYELIVGGVSEPNTLTLSPIAEISDSNIIDSSLSEEQPETSFHHVQGGTVTCQSLPDSSGVQTPVDKMRPCSLEFPTTPPEILRDRYLYAQQELDTLREFTKIERQFLHEHCVSQDEVNLLKNELDSISVKMQLLIEENTDFRNELEREQGELMNLNKVCLASKQNQKVLNNLLVQIVRELTEHTKTGSSEEYPSLQVILENYDANKELDVLCLQQESLTTIKALGDIQKLIKHIINDKDILKKERDMISEEHIKLKQNINQILLENKQLQNRLNNANKEIDVLNEKLSSDIELLRIELESEIQDLESVVNRTGHLENTITTTCQQNVLLKDVIICLEEDNKKVMSDLQILQLKFNKLADLQELTQIEKVRLEEKIENFKTDIKHACSLVFNELRNKLDFKTGLECIIGNMNINQCMFEDFELFLGSNTQKCIIDVFDQIKINLECYDKDISVIINQFAVKINALQCKNNKLKADVKMLQNTVKGELNSRLSKLESLHVSKGGRDKSIQTEVNDNDQTFEKKYVHVEDIRNEVKSMFDKYYTYSDFESIKYNKMFSLFLENIINFPVLNQVLDSNTKALVSQLFNKIDQTFHVFEENQRKLIKKVEDLNLNFEVLKNEKQIGDKTTFIKSPTENKYRRMKDGFQMCEPTKVVDCDATVQLATLKKHLMTEISNIDRDEIMCDLYNCSPEELWNKFIHCIMNMEMKIVNDHEQKLLEKQDILDELKKKIKSLESVAMELETENIKLQSEIKTHRNNCNSTQNEVCILKTNILIMAVENSELKDKLEAANRLIEAEKDIVNSLKNTIHNLEEENKKNREELSFKKSAYLDLKSKQQQKCMCTLSAFNSEYEKFSDSKNKKPTTNVSAQETISSQETKWSVEKFNEEQLLLLELLETPDLKYSVQMLEKFHLLKEIVQVVLNKIFQLQTVLNTNQLEFRNVVEGCIEDVNGFKLNLFQLYKQFVLDEVSCSNFDGVVTLKRELESIENECEKIGDGKGSNKNRAVESFKKELESVQMDCLEIKNLTKACQNSVQLGQSFINSLTEQFTIILNETSRKDTIIENLNKCIADEKAKSKNTKSRAQEIENRLTNLLQENNHLKDKLTILNSQLGDSNTFNENLNERIANEKERHNDTKLQLQEIHNQLNNLSQEKKHWQDKVTLLNNQLNDCQITNKYLNERIADEKNENEDSKLQLLSQVNNLQQENKLLQDKINILDMELSDYNSIFSSPSFECFKNVAEKVNVLKEMLIENKNNKFYAAAADESISFFSHQCSLMRAYINKLDHIACLSAKNKKHFQDKLRCLNVMVSCTLFGSLCENKENKLYLKCKEYQEIKSSVAEAYDQICFFIDQFGKMNKYINEIELMFNNLLNQKNHSDFECNLMKNQLSNVKNHLEKNSIVIKDLLALFPVKPVTPAEAIRSLQQIIVNHTRLREAEINLRKKINTAEDTIAKQKEEIKSLAKMNDNCKMDLEKCEDHVRNLRSELRTLRGQYHNRLVGNSLESTTKLKNLSSAELGVQTDSLCCTQLNEDNAVLKNTIFERNTQISHLKGMVESVNSVYKNKCSDLERALVQANEKLKSLNVELIHQQNSKEDLLDRLRNHETNPDANG